MSQDIAIKVENLSKCYHIYDTPRDRLMQFVVPMLYKAGHIFSNGVPRSSVPSFYKEFWAIRDVSIEIRRGETVGIIGRNGSGKSTLLQLICGTLNPTGGNILVNGRVAALLELGSGFNPEFTGRENVYLNATVLGLSEQEIDERFDEIEAFADIGDFIDQPVKTYSSGMMVRLAFAVIANVDADILIVDEALAVGDAIFTQKCMRFLRNFKKNGTLFFVSHDVGTVNNLCDRAIWLQGGRIKLDGIAVDVTKIYSEFCTQEIYGDSLKIQSIRNIREEVHPETSVNKIDYDTQVSFYEDIANSDGWKTGVAEIKRVSIMELDGKPINQLAGGETVLLRIEVDVHQALASPIIGFFVKDRLGQCLFGDNTYSYCQPSCMTYGGEKIVAEFVFSLPMLPNGDYSMTVAIADGDPRIHTQHHWLHDAVIMHVQSKKFRYGLVGIPFQSVTMKKYHDVA